MSEDVEGLSDDVLFPGGVPGGWRRPNEPSPEMSPDAARMAPDGPQTDPTGLGELITTMASVRQVRSAARLSGFSDAEAFQLARDYFTTMLRISAEAQQ